jgi:hypothetical protein
MKSLIGYKKAYEITISTLTTYNQVKDSIEYSKDEILSWRETYLIESVQPEPHEGRLERARYNIQKNTIQLTVLYKKMLELFETFEIAATLKIESNTMEMVGKRVEFKSSKGKIKRKLQYTEETGFHTIAFGEVYILEHAENEFFNVIKVLNDQVA